MRPLAFSSAAFEGAFLLGDLDRAFVWLDRAIDNREVWHFSRLRLAPELAPLRADPRFVAAMTRLEAIEKPSP